MYDTYIPDKGFVETFFRISNRINRKRYIKRMLALMGITFILGFLVNFSLLIVGSFFLFDLLPSILKYAFLCCDKFMVLYSFVIR